MSYAKVINLVENGVATNHTDNEETGWIIICNIEPNDETVRCKSVYDRRLAKTDYGEGGKFWIVRLRLDKYSSKPITYNETTESILFKDEMPLYPLEFAKNKLLVTGTPSHMYLVDDWFVLKCIHDPITENTYKNFAFPLPGFNEVSFPFIAVCGKCHISILNIATLEHKPLTNGIAGGYGGLRFAFA